MNGWAFNRESEGEICELNQYSRGGSRWGGLSKIVSRRGGGNTPAAQPACRKDAALCLESYKELVVRTLPGGRDRTNPPSPEHQKRRVAMIAFM